MLDFAIHVHLYKSTVMLYDRFITLHVHVLLSQGSLRMVVTRDLDVSMAMFIQFVFKFGCQFQTYDWPKAHSILLQHSSNGGISWNLVKEIHYKNTGKPRYK